MVTAYPAEDELGSLAPLVAGTGWCNWLAGHVLLPLKFHLTSACNPSQPTASASPTAARMLDILEHQDISSKAVASTDVLPLLPFCVKLPTDSLEPGSRYGGGAIALIRHDAEIYRHRGLPRVHLPHHQEASKLQGLQNHQMARHSGHLYRSLGVLQRREESEEQAGSEPAEVTAFEPLLPPGERQRPRHEAERQRTRG